MPCRTALLCYSAGQALRWAHRTTVVDMSGRHVTIAYCFFNASWTFSFGSPSAVWRTRLKRFRCWHWGWSSGDWGVFQPTQEVFHAKFFNIRFAWDFDIIARLETANAIEKCDQSHLFYGHGEVVIDQIIKLAISADLQAIAKSSTCRLKMHFSPSISPTCKQGCGWSEWSQWIE